MNYIDQKKQMRNRMRIVLILIFVVAIYFSGLITTIVHNGFSNVALGVIQEILHLRVPLSLFLFLFFAMLGIAMFALHLSWEKNEHNDVMGRNFKMAAKAQPYGDAHFEFPEEYENLAQIRKVEDCKGIILGMLDDKGSECIDFNPATRQFNKNTLVIGASGTGKSYTFVKTYLYQAAKLKHSIILTDPDCGLYEDTASFFENQGYTVRRLNFVHPEHSDGWDCLKMLSYGHLEINAGIFAEIITSNISDGKNDIYASGGKSLLTAIILYVMTNPAYDGVYTETDVLERSMYLKRMDMGKPRRNIREVMHLLTLPGGLEELEENYFNKDIIPPESVIALAPFYTFKGSSPNLAGNILTHVAVGMSLLQQDYLSRLLSTDDIDLQLPASQPCIYFCHFPVSHETYRFLISLFFSMFFIVLMDVGESTGTRLPRPVDFLMDEFPSIGIIPDWSAKMANIRKYDINAIMIVQDIIQLRKNYYDSWQVILDNCSTKVIIGINEAETAKMIQTIIGQTSTQTESESQTPSSSLLTGKKTTSVSAGIGKRDLLSLDELLKMKSDESLILFFGHNPIISHKTPHVIHPFSKLCEHKDRNDYPSIEEPKRRAQMRTEEEERLNKYWQNHNMSAENYMGNTDDIVKVTFSLSPVQIIIDVLKDDLSSILQFFKKNKVSKNKSFLKKEKEKTEKAIPTEESKEPSTVYGLYGDDEDGEESGALDSEWVSSSSTDTTEMDEVDTEAESADTETVTEVEDTMETPYTVEETSGVAEEAPESMSAKLQASMTDDAYRRLGRGAAIVVSRGRGEKKAPSGGKTSSPYERNKRNAVMRNAPELREDFSMVTIKPTSKRKGD